jgi:hypothetical protein
MDIYKEINILPNFLYTFDGDDGKYHFAILGGHVCPASKTYEFIDATERIQHQMIQLYEHVTLSDEDKTQLAKLMHKMQSVCEKRKVGLNTLSEQKEYIEKLSPNEKAQIEKQVKMYKDCRCFYRDYVYNK